MSERVFPPRKITRLYSFLVDHGIAQQRLAQVTGINRSRCHRICAGKLPPSPEERQLISRTLDVSEGEIFSSFSHLTETDQKVEKLAEWIRSPEGRLVIERISTAIGL